MTPSTQLPNHSHPFSLQDCATRAAYSRYPIHHPGLTPSAPALKSLVTPDVPESSAYSNTFASHKAHRSFQGAIGKLPKEPPEIPPNPLFHPAHWMHWSAPTNALDTVNTFNNDHLLDRPRSNNTGSVFNGKDIHAPSGAYRTRSLVQHPLNLAQSSKPEPSVGSSNPSACELSNVRRLPPSQIGPPRSPDQLESLSNGPTFASGPRSVLNGDKSPGLADESRLVKSTFVSHRNKDGLPSNSHHLLNSPELKTALVNQFPQGDSNYFSQLEQEQFAVNPGPRSLSDQETQPAVQPPKSARSTTRLSSTASQKGQAGLNLQAINNSNDAPDNPPSEDAASILLELSRHEPPKYGMSLRRGRGGANSRSDPPGTGDERPSMPMTPGGRRYKTRSQMHEEAVSKQLNHPDSAISLSICAENPGKERKEQPINSNKRNPNPVPLDLGYGLPTGYSQGLISVSGSTSASTCTSRSNTGDGSSLNVTPGYESNLTLHNFKTHGYIPGRLHLKLSGGSAALGMSHSSAPNAIVPSGTAFMDDDAKSSFSVSTQATSLISPPAYFTHRTFPPEVPIDLNFPRLYRTFFVPSAFGDHDPIKSQAESYKIPVMKTPANSNYNTPAHGYLDLYTPRYVKGVGAEKLGLCCICAESKERGGEDTALWLKMKVSSYSYHLSFFHGINNADGLPFSPPAEIRLVERCHVVANEKLELKEGLCHHCNMWIPMEGVKMQEVKVPELFWWKHAKSCHKSRLAGECQVHIPDEIYDLVTRQQPTTGSLYNGSGGGSLPASSCSTPYSHYNLGEIPTSNSPYASRNPASPAPTCSSVSQSGGSRVHPSVAAQRASAGRVYKRKASNSSLGRKRRDSGMAANQSNSPQSSIWQPLPLSVNMNTSNGASTASIQSHQYFLQNPQSPTPMQPNYPVPTDRKTRRSNMLD